MRSFNTKYLVQSLAAISHRYKPIIIITLPERFKEEIEKKHHIFYAKKVVELLNAMEVAFFAEQADVVKKMQIIVEKIDALKGIYTEACEIRTSIFKRYSLVYNKHFLDKKLQAMTRFIEALNKKLEALKQGLNNSKFFNMCTDMHDLSDELQVECEYLQNKWLLLIAEYQKACSSKNPNINERLVLIDNKIKKMSAFQFRTVQRRNIFYWGAISFLNDDCVAYSFRNMNKFINGVDNTLALIKKGLSARFVPAADSPYLKPF